MSIETIAKIILAVSIGVYCLHLVLVFRQIFRKTSDLRTGSPEAEWLRFTENEERLHKIVQDPLICRDQLHDEEAEEKH